MIKRRINTTGLQETEQAENQGVENSFHDFNELIARGEISISVNEASEEKIIVVNELKKIYDLGEKAEGIIFKSLFKKFI